MAKVRIKASQRVFFDQIVEMPEHDIERLKEAQDNADEAEITWLAEQYLNREDVAESSEFEVTEVFPCTKNGARRND